MNHPFSRPTKAPKKHLLHKRWANLKQCISNPNHTNYNVYGGKGITMDKGWSENFIIFLLWATQNNFKSDFVLTRRDKTKGFEPSNCFFAEHSHSIEPFKI